MAIQLESTATGGGAGTTVTVAHTIGTVPGAGRLLIVSASNWTGAAYGVTGATFNGVAGTRAFVQSTTNPPYLTCWYWKDSQLPGGGSYNIVVSQSANDCAVASMLFSGVDQNAPVVAAAAEYDGAVRPIMYPLSGDSVYTAIGILGTNTHSADAPLVSATSVQSGNARVVAAYIKSPFRASQVSITTTGDARTSIGYIVLRETARETKARRLYLGPALTSLSWGAFGAISENPISGFPEPVGGDASYTDSGGWTGAITTSAADELAAIDAGAWNGAHTGSAADVSALVDAGAWNGAHTGSAQDAAAFVDAGAWNGDTSAGAVDLFAAIDAGAWLSGFDVGAADVSAFVDAGEWLSAFTASGADVVDGGEPEPEEPQIGGWSNWAPNYHTRFLINRVKRFREDEEILVLT